MSTKIDGDPPRDEDFIHGASEADLARPAGDVLADVPWGGVAPDPDTTDAATFLAWL